MAKRASLATFRPAPLAGATEGRVATVTEPEAAAVAAQLAGLPTLSVQAMKRTLNSTATTDLRAALAAETAATVAGFLDPLTTQLLQDFG